MPTFGSLFSGIGGIDLGLERAGWTCRWQVENDPYCQRVLTKHWPNVPKYGDVKLVTGDDLERVDLIAGGFPCQPVSLAGKGLAQKDPRWLWPEFARLVRELRPRLVLVENVPGLRSRGLGDVLGALATSGYDAEWDCIPASAIGAPHTRDRVFIVATDADTGDGQAGLGLFANDPSSLLATKDRNCSSVWVAPPCVPARVGHGFTCWVERRERTEVIGNAVVPQVAEWIGRRLLTVSA